MNSNEMIDVDLPSLQSIQLGEYALDGRENDDSRVVGEWRKKRETPKSPLYPHLLNESHPSDPIYESVRLKVGPKVPTSYERPK